MTIQERLDSLPLSRFHYRLVILGGLGWLFDSMDSLLMALALPALPDTWGLDNIRRGYLLTASMLGMLVGAAGAGTLADRVGRQRLFQWTLLLFSAATGLCAFAQGFWSLLLLRFLVGLGLGGELPVASALVTEFSPAAHRGRLVILLESFWSVGALVAAAVARLIPSLGWRFVFLIGSLPALYVLVLRRSMPESARFLLAGGRNREALEVLRRVERACGQPPAVVSLSVAAAGAGAPAAAGAEAGTDAPPAAGAEAAPRAAERTGAGERPEQARPRVRLADLFAAGLRKRTALLWLLWFGMVFSYYGIFTWLPSLLAADGLTLVQTYRYTFLITLAQIPGYFAAAALVDRLGRRTTLLLFLVPCALAAFGYSAAHTPAEVLLCGALISFFNLGAWGVVYTYTPELYPTRLRGTGAGWASAVGRIGGITAPLAVPAVLERTGSQAAVFWMFSGVLLLTAVVAWLGEETRARSLEEISG
jgi:putative MFS transporter